MRRVVQTRTGADGNCLNACLASILELPLRAVPEFGDDWAAEVNDFLSKYGLAYRRAPVDGAKPSGYSTIEGVSPRGGLHACVAYDGELAWDPHPIEDGTGQGLVEPRYYGLLEPLQGRAMDAGEVCKNCGKAIYLEDGTWKHSHTWSARCLGRPRSAKKNGWVAEVGDATARIFTVESGPSMRPMEYRFATNGVISYRVVGKGKLFTWQRYGTLMPGESPEQWFKRNGKIAKATDRADMLQLRKNTERQGGPFFMQETTKSGRERTIPVRELAKGADASPAAWAALLVAIYALLHKEPETPPTYDLTKYRPKKRSFDKEGKPTTVKPVKPQKVYTSNRHTLSPADRARTRELYGESAIYRKAKNGNVY
jgi:hypothetical protein